MARPFPSTNRSATVFGLPFNLPSSHAYLPANPVHGALSQRAPNESARYHVRLSTFARLEIVDETIVTDITALCLVVQYVPRLMVRRLFFLLAMYVRHDI